MYEYLNGVIADIGENYVVVDINGMGFRTICSQNTIKDLNIGKVTKIYTELVIRDDNIILYGFSNKTELKIFKLLTSVSGVGPKVAVSVLSSLKIDELTLAIATKDYKELTRAPGVGKKTAERIILELKDKINGDSSIIATVTSDDSDNIIQVVQALISLGYNYNEASMALSSIENKNRPVDSLIKEALKRLSRI
ncbi:MAG: Holliday junction branch migration protein RuvA [Firmicutes bacterium]|nr:Holliday junction branch migration protein RuvA [Bacillota bacterium]